MDVCQKPDYKRPKDRALPTNPERCEGACSEQETVKKASNRWAQTGRNSLLETGGSQVGRPQPCSERKVIGPRDGEIMAPIRVLGSLTVQNGHRPGICHNHITISKDNRVVQNLINSYLLKFQGESMITNKMRG